MISQATNISFVIPDGLPIRAVIGEAVKRLVGNRSVPGGRDHTCADCVHDYIPPGSGPVVDPGIAVDGSILHGEDLHSQPIAAVPALHMDDVGHTIVGEPMAPPQVPSAHGKVRAKVLDGTVMGPLVCYFICRSTNY